jgi:hypothetical protein
MYRFVVTASKLVLSTIEGYLPADKACRVRFFAPLCLSEIEVVEWEKSINNVIARPSFLAKAISIPVILNGAKQSEESQIIINNHSSLIIYMACL